MTIKESLQRSEPHTDAVTMENGISEDPVAKTLFEESDIFLDLHDVDLTGKDGGDVEQALPSDAYKERDSRVDDNDVIGENDNGHNSKLGPGCLSGLKRDGHVKHAIMYFVLIGLLIIFLVKAIRLPYRECFECNAIFGIPFFGIGLFGSVYVVFLIETFFFSSSYKYLKSINTTKSIGQLIETLRKTRPAVALKIVCYHTTSHEVSTKNSDGTTSTRTETSNVVTYTGRKIVNIASFTDKSIPLKKEAIDGYQLVKAKFSKTFEGDAEYTRQERAFILANKDRDKSYTFSVDFEIPGFQPHVLAFTDLSHSKPLFLEPKWFILSHVFIVGALPYRVWFSSITSKVSPNIHKFIYACPEASPTAENNNQGKI